MSVHFKINANKKLLYFSDCLNAAVDIKYETKCTAVIRSHLFQKLCF